MQEYFFLPLLDIYRTLPQHATHGDNDFALLVLAGDEQGQEGKLPGIDAVDVQHIPGDFIYTFFKVAAGWVAGRAISDVHVGIVPGPGIGGNAFVRLGFGIVGIAGNDVEIVFAFKMIEQVGVGTYRPTGLAPGQEPVDEDEDGFHGG